MLTDGDASKEANDEGLLGKISFFSPLDASIALKP